MKFRLEREGGLIVKIEPMDSTIVYQNSVLVHRLEADCELLPGERLYATLGNKQSNGEFTDLTVPLAMGTTSSYIEDEKTYYECIVKMPNQILKEAGEKGVAFTILIPRGTEPETYRQVTSGNAEFQVGASLAGVDYESIPDSNVSLMQDEIDSIAKDVSKAEAAATIAQTAATIAQAAAESTKEAAKTYEKSFTKGEWAAVNGRYRLIVQQNEHGFQNPYVDKILIEFEDEDGVHMSEVSYEDKILTVTKAIMVYVDVPLASYSQYSGKIIIKGV